MATTKVRSLSMRELHRELQDLLRLATEYAVLEDRLERKAKEIDRADLDGFDQFFSAVHAETEWAVKAAQGESGSELDALQICQSIQDAIDVLTFAIERDDRVR